MTKFQELLSRHAASSLLKQQQLSVFLGDHNWNVDLGTGKADFGKGRVYPLQVIGTESEVSNTWLWGWANEGSNIPPSLLTCALELKELGTKERIEELTQPDIDLDEVDGHLLSLVASGVCKADAYYRGPYDGGALFFALHEMPPFNQQGVAALELVQVMSSVISQFPVDHRTMVKSFLTEQGYSLDESARKIFAVRNSEDEINIGFDADGHIEVMETTLSAEPQGAAKKPWWKFGK